MSRIGQQPVPIPSDVNVEIMGSQVKVKGPKGELVRTFSDLLSISQDGDSLSVERSSDDPAVRALHGTTRALLSNMVVGVVGGWSKVLQIEGVGYRADVEGDDLVMSLGFSHPVIINPPPGIEFEVDTKERTVTVQGIDKEQVGRVASEVRGWRPPEPYKGKGVRYQGEWVRRKAGKAGKVE